MPNFVSKYWTYDHPPNTICQKVYKVTLCHFLLETEQKIDGAAYRTQKPANQSAYRSVFSNVDQHCFSQGT